ncbi:MAG: trypsin-like peptidase domain-containing protein [Planctomycetaceae bacterium]|nr:trypsin-like peptidase domain-containing protein [Planctomycetaceae bacterium]
MARRQTSILASVGMLSIGLAIGGHLESLRLTQSARAFTEEGKYEARIPPSAAALVESGNHISGIADSVMPSAVHIQAIRAEAERKVEETGSGVLMRSKSVRGLFVITNNHVIRGAENAAIDVILADGSKVHPQKVFRDTESDIAIIQIPDGGQPTARWGDSNSVNIGHFVLAVGSPFGLSQSVTMGIVSAKGRRDLSLSSDQSVTNQDFIQTDAAINPGNSGGPLIDMYGSVVGINTAIASNSGGNEGIGFSIPSNLVRHVFDQMVEHGKVRRAYLGVELDNNFTDATAQRLGLSRAVGARIVRVYSHKSSPAVMAGLRPDDVIVSFNGVKVIDENHLINLVSLSDIGSSVRMEIYRQRQTTLHTVLLTDRDDYRSAEQAPETFLTR